MDMKRGEVDQAELDEEMLEILLKLAETGPSISAEEVSRARESLRPLWMQTVRRRRTRRAAAVLVGLAAATLLVVALTTMVRSSPSGRSESIVGLVAAVNGQVWMESPSSVRTPLRPGATIPNHARLGTDANARAALRLSSGHDLRLDRSTTVEIPEAGVIRLAGGAVYLDSGHVSSSGVRVVTPVGDAVDIGTSFAVRYEKENLQVLVRSGSVLLDLHSGRMRVDRGRAVSLSPGDQPVWRNIESHAAEWEWAREVLPPFQVEGRTVSTFLKWYERETGRRIVFRDREAARLAAETTLHGTTLRSAPEKVAEGVLLSAGLDGAARNGSLEISSISSREANESMSDGPPARED